MREVYFGFNNTNLNRNRNFISRNLQLIQITFSENEDLDEKMLFLQTN